MEPQALRFVLFLENQEDAQEHLGVFVLTTERAAEAAAKDVLRGRVVSSRDIRTEMLCGVEWVLTTGYPTKRGYELNAEPFAIFHGPGVAALARPKETLRDRTAPRGPARGDP